MTSQLLERNVTQTSGQSVTQAGTFASPPGIFAQVPLPDPGTFQTQIETEMERVGAVYDAKGFDWNHLDPRLQHTYQEKVLAWYGCQALQQQQGGVSGEIATPAGST